MNTSSRLTADTAAVSVLVLLAHNLPDTYHGKRWLVILAPSATTVVIFLWCKFTAAVEQQRAERELRDSVTAARQTMQDALKNPDATPPHRLRLIKMSQGFELLLVQTEVSRVDRCLAKVRGGASTQKPVQGQVGPKLFLVKNRRAA